MNLLKKLFGDYSTKELKRINPIVEKVLAKEDEYANMDDAALRAQTDILKSRLAGGETLDDILPDAFAVCREAAWRVLGMKHFPVQIIGGIILHQGRIAEMKTGEGKTLVATLPAYLNALAGNGVHIVTVNDYLARRDSEWMGKVYRWLGLTVGLVVPGIEKADKKDAYNCDITYGTNNEFGFDYLRDNMVKYKADKVQRGHAFAIVDEVDSILIDEARTPLIISGHSDESSDMYERADSLVRTFRAAKIAEANDKEDNDELYADYDYIVDEKARTATLTQRGVKKAEQAFGLENLSDPENITVAHHINQAIKARGVMTRDIDYVVENDKVIIVDEFTGRLMYGRRYSDGLHQAIEAKENVHVENESKTLATITFQNYFRLYKKLSGMTGTAITEEAEFREIYKLDCIAIPTNRELARIDRPDIIYCTEKAKFNAVIERIIESHSKGQPVLVGTISIEKSELLSKMLSRRGVKHEVLNAKQHAKEAEIVAQAGKLGAVTIATNMAGRGTDIILGGNAEFLAKAQMKRLGYEDEMIERANAFDETDDETVLEARKVFGDLSAQYKKEIAIEAEKVREAGGLLIIGTERHDSRRIDNQLRGRSGRQGDPGESQFYISTEDDIARLFGGDRLKNLMETFNIFDDNPITLKAASSAIETAQSRVEGHNFNMRKHVLQYDDVMNRQREIIYSQRDMVLNGESIRDHIMKMIDESIEAVVKRTAAVNINEEDGTEERSLDALRAYYDKWLIDDECFEQICDMDNDEIVDVLRERAHKRYEAREQQFGDKLAREIDNYALLESVDRLWMDHIDAMDELKRGIGLRAYAQKDPVVMYTLEGFDMFDEMIASIKESTAKLALVVVPVANEVVRKSKIVINTNSSGDGTDKQSKTVRNKGKKVGANELCPCGSGKKYKKCCGSVTKNN